MSKFDPFAAPPTSEEIRPAMVQTKMSAEIRAAIETNWDALIQAHGNKATADKVLRDLAAVILRTMVNCVHGQNPKLPEVECVVPALTYLAEAGAAMQYALHARDRRAKEAEAAAKGKTRQ